MKRREFIIFLGGTAAAWPLAARAQQPERMRRIGVLMTLASNDPEGQTRIGAFLQGLQQSGWSIGRNVQIETRWAAGQADAFRKHASELVALAPDVILATGSATPGPLLQATRTVPIVFTAVPDPVGAGFVDSLARPGSARSAKRRTDSMSTATVVIIAAMLRPVAVSEFCSFRNHETWSSLQALVPVGRTGGRYEETPHDGIGGDRDGGDCGARVRAVLGGRRQ